MRRIRLFFIQGFNIQASGFHRCGKDDLSLCLAKMLQLTDKGVKLDCTGKGHFHQHGVISGNAVAFDNIGDAGNKGIKLWLLDGLKLHIDKGGDVKSKLHDRSSK